MTEKVAQRINATAQKDNSELAALFNVLVDELTVLRASIVGITAQLDLDATVTDTDYAATNDPAAITIEK